MKFKIQSSVKRKQTLKWCGICFTSSSIFVYIHTELFIVSFSSSAIKTEWNNFFLHLNCMENHFLWIGILFILKPTIIMAHFLSCMLVIWSHENKFGIRMMFIVFATILCKNQGRKNNTKQNIIHILIIPPQITISTRKSFRETGTDIYLSTIGIWLISIIGNTALISFRGQWFNS